MPLISPARARNHLKSRVEGFDAHPNCSQRLRDGCAVSVDGRPPCRNARPGREGCGPVRVGGVVKPPRLLYGPEPRFPTLARQARLNGTVVIDAIIDEHGNVIEARVVSGHPLLIEAALEAVKERRYEPTILDGEPIAIDLSVQVTFHFS